MRAQPALITFLILIILAVLLYYIRKRVTQRLYRSSKKHLRVYSGHCPKSHNDIYLNVHSGDWIQKTEYKRLNAKTADYINIWYMSSFPSGSVIIYYHGTDCNISHRKYMFEICRKLKVNLVLVDYRGFGKSEGKASSDNVLRDADAVYKFVSRFYPPHKIRVWGESLGGTPAIYIAARRPVAGLIILSTFTSFHSVIKGNYLLYYLARTVTSDIDENTNNLKMIGQVECPVLIYHSLDDGLIDYGNALDLLAAVPHNNKRLISIRGEHDKPRFSAEDFREIPRFIGVGEIDDDTVDEILNIIDNISEACSSAEGVPAGSSY